MKIWMMLSALVAALILAGCGTPVPDSDEQDWCYVFDFTTEQQGFLITSGSLTAQGITSDGTGLLQTSYGYNRDVYPNFVIVTVVRPTGVTGDIQATAAGTAFGIQTYFTATMPGDVNSAPLVFTPPTTGEEIIGDRNAINITVDGSQPIAIASIDIRGMGASPFPSNPCDDSTPTPGTPTGTPSGTPSATASATVTGTLSPTPTPTTWECYYDFRIDDYDFTPNSFYGAVTAISWVSGQGWKSGDGNGFQGVVIGKNNWLPSNASISMTGFEIISTSNRVSIPANDGNQHLVTLGSVIWGQSIHLEVPSPLTVNRVGAAPGWTGSTLTLTLWSTATSTPANKGDIYVHSLRMMGTGSAPTNCPAFTTPTPTPGPTNTPGATNTPGPTNTPEPLWSACTDFTASNYSFIGINAEYEDERGFIQEGPEWSVGRTGMDSGKKRKLKIQFGAGQTFTGQIRLSDNGSNNTSWLSVSGNTIFVEYSAASWTPSTSFFVEFDGNEDDLILEKICYIDPAPSTGTPIPGTLTPVGTRTPLPTVTSAPLPSRTPIQVPAPVILITSTAGVMITSTPIYGGTGVYQATGTPYGTPVNNSEGNAGDVGEMAGFALEIGVGLGNTLGAYLGQAGDIVGGLLGAFANAEPQPIPGLPLCITNPMAHDICAIYYIMDFTLLSPGTPGALIVHLLLIIFNIHVAIYFVRWIMRLVWRGETVTHVE